MGNEPGDSHARVVSNMRLARAFQGQADRAKSMEVTIGIAAVATMHYLATLTELLVSEHPEFDGEL